MHRLRLWDRLKSEVSVPMAGPPISVRVFLRDQLIADLSGVGRGVNLLSVLPRSVQRTACVALDDAGQVHCLHRPLLADGRSFRIQEFPVGPPVDGNEPACMALWHSAAHLLGGALESTSLWSPPRSVLLTDGPPLSDSGGGFFYEFSMRSSDAVDPAGGSGAPECLVRVADFEGLLQHMRAAAKADYPFERLDLSERQARELFADNPLKLELIDRLSGDAQGRFSAYRCGEFVDLCRGPHVARTGQIRAMDLLRVSGSHDHQHERGDNQPIASVGGPLSADGVGGAASGKLFLQRVYGIAFPKASQLAAWTANRAAAADRDHRRIGRDQKLWSFHAEAPGAPFLLPHGVRIFLRLQAMLRREYVRFGFDEVMTPLLYNQSLWEQSGHWDVYRDDMFHVDPQQGEPAAVAAAAEPLSSHCLHEQDSTGGRCVSLKPMNCPAHCLMFGESVRSHRDLPIRWSDFSPLHRNELAGALSGLTRVRVFHQDDGHIFCTADQVGEEIERCLEFLELVYGRLGFARFQYTLSTRPADQAERIGSDAAWDRAETQLRGALAAAPAPVEGQSPAARSFVEAPGEGAFYGPKIDVLVRDALDRPHQLGTIQLDFQLPERFQLQYVGPDGAAHRPVMIHRAIMGSMERALAVLAESCGGAWPLWLAPRQVAVLPVSPIKHGECARQLVALLREGGVHAELFDDAEPLRRRLRDAASLRINYLVTIGDNELAEDTVTFRKRRDVELTGAANHNQPGAPATAATTTTLPVCDFISLVNKETCEFL